MKKLLSLFLAMILVSAITVVPASAVFAENEKPNDIAFIIETDSAEEYERVLNQIDASNARANALWQKALAESQLSENQIDFSKLEKSPGQYKTIRTSKLNIDLLTGIAHIVFAASYIEGTDAYNHALFGEIRYVDAYGYTSETDVIVKDSPYTIIDSGRTLAVNYSLRIGIRDAEGDFTYKTKNYYVEFYSMTEDAKVF